MMTQTRSTFAIQERSATPCTQAGGRGNGGVIITARICNPEDDGKAAAISAAQAIIRQRIETILSVTDDCNVTLPEQCGNVTLTLHQGGAM